MYKWFCVIDNIWCFCNCNCNSWFVTIYFKLFILANLSLLEYQMVCIIFAWLKSLADGLLTFICWKEVSFLNKKLMRLLLIGKFFFLLSMWVHLTNYNYNISDAQMTFVWSQQVSDFHAHLLDPLSLILYFAFSKYVIYMIPLGSLTDENVHYLF